MAGASNSDIYQRLTVLSTLARDNFQPRRWGMVITVIDSGVATDYQLVYGAVDSDINNNANWVAGNATIVSTNLKYQEKAIPQISGATSGAATVLLGADIADGDSVLLEIPWAAKDDDTNTGAGGLFISCWTKAGGVLNKVFDDDAIKGADTGDTYTISSVDSGGNIRVQISAVGAASNFSVAWMARITQRKS